MNAPPIDTEMRDDGGGKIVTSRKIDDVDTITGTTNFFLMESLQNSRSVSRHAKNGGTTPRMASATRVSSSVGRTVRIPMQRRREKRRALRHGLNLSSVPVNECSFLFRA